MELKFSSINEARNHLIEAGYNFDGYGILTKAEVYVAGPLVALVRRVPFGNVKVTIR